MTNNVVLCKIAVEVSAQDNDEEEMDADCNARNFKYGSKLWRPLDFLSASEVETIKRMLRNWNTQRTNLIFTETGVGSEQNDMEEQEQETTRHLAVAYCVAPSRCSQLMHTINFEMRRQLFPVLFKDYASQFALLGGVDDTRDTNTTGIGNAQPTNDDDNDSDADEDDLNEDEQAINNEKQSLLPQQRQNKRYVTTKLYEALYKKHCQVLALDPAPPAALQLPVAFLPTLCRYQERSVAWLLKRETTAETSLHSFYMPLVARDASGVCYMHKYKLHLQRDEPAPLRLPPGGILADEMGLGKTVEMLALLLLHQRRNFVVSMPAFVPDCVAPKRAKRARMSLQILCICNNYKSAKNLKQCAKCQRWQHAHCVGEVAASESATDEDYLCPSCWHTLITADDSHKARLLPTGATFIVTPLAIKSQWLSEIRRHTSSLRVLVYEGVTSKRWISPLRLASDYDIVITDYMVLRSEFYYTSTNQTERVTRNKPRFMRVHTPLLMLEWWRVCLDEAQMVESNTSNIASLVRMLPAVNRWAITGTPIQRSIDDLSHLLRFIGFNEVISDDQPTVWNNLVHDFVLHHNDHDNHDQVAMSTSTSSSPPCQRPLPLIDVLQLCMWRTSKSDVTDELLIPPQGEEVHHIRLSNLETLFYMEQHADCAEKFNETLDKHIRRAYGISPQIMNQILQPLLKIRQCCNMPVVNEMRQNKNAASGNTLKQNFMHPKELHTHLKSANEVDCKNELRSMASSHNGIAGIYFLHKDYAEAIKHYELVLKLAREYSDFNITVDSLLQIHALHNMLEAYYISPIEHQKLPTSTLEDYEQLRDKLEWRYLEPYAEQVVSTKSAVVLADEAMLKCLEASKQKRNNLNVNEVEIENEKAAAEANDVNADIEAVEKEKADDSPSSPTDVVELLAALFEILDIEQEQLLVNRIHEECFGKFLENVRVEQIHSARTALLTVIQWWDKVTRTEECLSTEFADLCFFTDNIRVRNQVNTATWRRMMEFISSVYDCHLSEIRDNKSKDDATKTAEKAAKQKRKKLCKLCIIRNHLNTYECLLWNKTIDQETNVSEGQEVPSMEMYLIKVIFNFMKLKHKFHTPIKRIEKHLECMQHWCKKLIKFWIEIEYTVKAYDELDMCKMRISLTDDKADKSIYRIAEHELDATLRDNQMNLYDAQRKFTVKLARLKYLTHLEGDIDAGPCPICRSKNETYAVLECGHHICYACLKQIRHYNKQLHNLTCPICRNKQNTCKIYYVMRDSAEPQAETQQLVGNYSSKIAYIVRLILRLQTEHSKQQKEPPKILIFSQWLPILLAIATALTENKIQHRLKWSPQTIEEFKSPRLGVTCLLMLLSRGSKGLNLIEATHVFLVEPILNPGEELQAIGRVHRFGQTKPTTVHRFIVRNTIEENVYNVVMRGKESEPNWEFNKLSLENLRDLFKLDNDLIEDFENDS